MFEKAECTLSVMIAVLCYAYNGSLLKNHSVIVYQIKEGNEAKTVKSIGKIQYYLYESNEENT